MTDWSKPLGFPTATTQLADAQARRVAELGRDERVGLGAQDGEVGERVGADDLGAELGAVREGGADPLRAGRRRGREVTMKPSCEITTPLPLPRAAAQVRDRRHEALADRDDDARVGVERVFSKPPLPHP